MAKSAPHVYLSALPFAPARSLVSAHYSSIFPRIVRVERERLSHWPSSEMVINAGDKVNSIALSPDGQRIVSGSDDGTIRVWNATTGETDAGPFTGHTRPVSSVGFLPDGQRIVSSGDVSIRMLDTTTRNTETTRHVDFTDQSVIDSDGWICGSGGELLMWIPRVHRTGLHRPRNIWVASECETRIDLSDFVHGHSWATCVNT